MTITQRTLEEQQERQRWFNLSHEMRRFEFLEMNPPELWDDNGFALLYTFMWGGGSHNYVRFAMSVEDAMKFCKDPRTSRAVHAGGYSYAWTALENFMAENNNTINTSKLKDNNSFDNIIDELGLTKYPISQFKELFEPLGYTVK